MTTTTVLATEKQINFLKKLSAERLTPKSWDELPQMISKGLNSKEASLLIRRALTFPKLPPTIAAPAGNRELWDALAEVPKAKYALPFEDLKVFIPGIESRGNDFLFVEVKEYMKRRYIRRLTGSVGDFTRSKMPVSASIAILGMIKLDPAHHSQKFGELFSVCGVCTAPLTDALSRELNLGPECRKRFGL